MSFSNEKWKPEKPTIDKNIKKDYDMNGNYELLKDRLAAIPSGDGKGTYLERNAAVAWAMLIQKAVEYNSGSKKPFGTLKIGNFISRDSTDTFRPLWKQEYYWKKFGPPRAAKIGTSNHGWAVAIDFRFGDPQEGRAVSNELKWLEWLTKPKDSKFNVFQPNLHSKDVARYKTDKNGKRYENPKWGSPINKDGSYNYYKTWHWSYYTKL